MLQQTTVTAVIPYYERFVSRFPTVQALAAAPLDTVLSAWAGLGYYARARNLHACAQAVAASGGFPADLARLQALPGIGAYTAAAIGAIAFGMPAVPVDGNVERVAARVFAIEQPLPAAKPAMRAAAARLGADPAARARPSDFAQALFDLGAGVCTPAAPGCAVCPWIASCAARRLGIQASLPRKIAEKGPAGSLRRAFLADRRRTAGAAAYSALQGSAGRHDRTAREPMARHALDGGGGADRAPMQSDWRGAGQVRHGFTHFELIIDVLAAHVPRDRGRGFRAAGGRAG